MRTDEEIVNQTNMLARLCLRYLGTGYEVPLDHKFYEAADPRSNAAWKQACEIQKLLTNTDPNDALTNLDEMQTYRIEVAMDVRAYGYVEVEACSKEQAIDMATPKIISENFKLRGHGAEDTDFSNPTSIYLSEIMVAGDPDTIDYIEKDLPDDARAAGWTTIMLEEAKALIDAIDGVTALPGHVQSVVDRLRAYVETSAP
ncbi:MAG: hypothetical protein M9924_21155 [Rhizobiaceae bacterium]|nr:hypothetical protein [Rhizobiaceae bacterium]